MKNYPRAFIGYAKQTDIRNTSSSGGICQILSEKVIQDNGVVSGIAFDSNYNTERILVTELKDLVKITKSKYVQPRQGNTFGEIKTVLGEGKKVLFVGTPCQVGGLLSFLGYRPDNLLCIDFICLGIPSELVWNKYCETVCGKERLTYVDFKDKRNGWRNFTFYLKTDSGKEIIEPGRSNPYMKAMISKISNRPACYQCKYRSIKRIADLTVSDAWGLEKIAPEMFNRYGTSAIMVNSEKGYDLLSSMSEQMVLKEVDKTILWENNKSAWKPYDMPFERNAFFKMLQRKGFSAAYRRWRFIVRIRKICSVFAKRSDDRG